jgi:hypothetical protein
MVKKRIVKCLKIYLLFILGFSLLYFFACDNTFEITHSVIIKFELLGVILISVLVGLTIFLVELIGERKSLPIKKRNKQIILITIVLSVLMVFRLGARLYDQNVASYPYRWELNEKMSKSDYGINGLSGYSAENLSIKHYYELGKEVWLPEITSEADSISIYHSYDDFLPDYRFQVFYYVKQSVTVDTFYIEDRSFSKRQSYTLTEGLKKVEYEEILW